MMRRVAMPGGRRGVTMVELLVAMGIISFIFLALGFVFSQAVRANNIGCGTAEVHQQARAVLNYLGRELAGIPRDGRLVLTSPAGALARWNVTVQGDVIAFTTGTPQPLRRSEDPAAPPAYVGFGAVCYYRWYASASDSPPYQMLFRVADRLDSGETLTHLNARIYAVPPNRGAHPYDTPDLQDQLAQHVVTPFASGSTVYGAFEVAFYDRASGAFVPLEDGGTEVYDSAVRGLPPAVRVRLRVFDHGGSVRDEVSGERGIEFEETYWLPAAP